MTPPRPIAAAMDLGTTIIKGALLLEGGTLGPRVTRRAPPLSGAGLVRESSPEDYLREALAVVSELSASAGPDLPLGVASQRSTFALWERDGGRALTPLISWQDRRAEAWCAGHRDESDRIAARTGLRLSPHYAGPKLAAILEADPSLTPRMAAGEVVISTLETSLIRALSDPSSHETDLTMAARTLLADPREGAWSPESLALFGVPVIALPRIRATAGFGRADGGPLRISASIADQAASALAVLGHSPEDALVSLGTGGFVLRLTGAELRALPGYLSGPVLWSGGAGAHFALEGTINAAAEALARFGDGPRNLPGADPDPGAFCLPDAAGIGSPHWRADLSLVFSEAGRRCDTAGKRRLVLEGLVFRVREILEALFQDAPPRRVLLAGGLTRERGLAEGLAACLGRPVLLLEDHEATLLGAARLAAGLAPGSPPARTEEIPPGPSGAYLQEKWPRWHSWIRLQVSPDP